MSGGGSVNVTRTASMSSRRSTDMAGVADNGMLCLAARVPMMELPWPRTLPVGVSSFPAYKNAACPPHVMPTMHASSRSARPANATAALRYDRLPAASLVERARRMKSRCAELMATW